MFPNDYRHPVLLVKEAANILDMPSILIGSVEEIIEKLHALHEQFGLTYFVISNSSIQEFAPIITRLAGK